jgi:hypothetical protein
VTGLLSADGQTVIVGFSTGGTGYGDPLDRDPAAAEVDVRKNLVSAQQAHRVYGVVIDPATNRVDEVATAQRRSELIAQRLARGVPYDEFEATWSTQRPDESIMKWFGSWPDGQVVTPVIRP